MLLLSVIKNYQRYLYTDNAFHLSQWDLMHLMGESVALIHGPDQVQRSFQESSWYHILSDLLVFMTG